MRAQRARNRKDWVGRKTTLAHADDGLPIPDPELGLAAMGPLIAECWAVAGLPIPDYPRSEAPGRVWRDGAMPPEHGS